MAQCKECFLPYRSAWYWPTFALRLMLGIIMLYHGWPKLFGGGIEGFSQELVKVGVFLPIFFAWVIALLEVVGGVALIVGFLPVVFSGLFIVEFIVATWLKAFTWKSGFASFTTTGYEFDLLILAAFVTLFWFSVKEAVHCKTTHHG